MTRVELDPQTRLVGERLELRPVRHSDWSALYAAASDREIWAQHPASDRYREPVFREFFDEALASGSAFVVIDRATGDIIGSSRYANHDIEKSEIEIGWTFLSRDYWGGEANREMKRLMLEHAFRFVDTVVFWIGDSNLRSRRAIEKLGASLRDDGIVRGGLPHVVYKLGKTDWSPD